MTTTVDWAASLYFGVRIDNQDLGAFTSCEGLGFDVELVSRDEGGNNGFIHQLPGRVRYQNITFTRPLGPDSRKLAAWFQSMGGQIRRTTAQITALSPDGRTVIASWSLDGVIPVRWSGPRLDAGSAAVATESFEIAHHGFLGGA